MNFITKAHHSAHESLSLLVRSTLLETSALALKKILVTKKRNNNSNTKSNKSINRCKNKNSNNVYHVTQKDVESAYKVAQQVGQKWMTKLRDAGEKEASIIVGIVLQNGRFFEDITDDIPREIFFQGDGHDGGIDIESLRDNGRANVNGHVNVNRTTADNDQQNTSVGNTNTNTNTNEIGNNIRNHQASSRSQSKKVVNALKSDIPFIAISQICGESPIILNQQIAQASSTTIHKETCWNPLPSKNKSLPCSSRLSLSHIPQCKKLPVDKLKTLPPNQLYGNPSKTLNEHSSILRCNPVLNRDEFTKSQIQILDGLGCDHHTLWPYEWTTIQNASARNKNRMYLQTITGNKRKDENDNGNEAQQESTHVTGRRKRTRNGDKQSNNSVIIGIPSDLATAQWSWGDIEKSFSENEKKILFKNVIHDYNDHEEEEQGKDSEFHKCVGALKVIGNVHLWEQVREDNWNGAKDTPMSIEDGSQHHVQKKRKKAHSKAKRQRLYPNVELKKVDDLRKMTSKVTFTESFGQHYMEFDLGECMMSLRSEKSTGQKQNEPRNLAFRSLEISLKD
jgi:hypothetical protein